MAGNNATMFVGIDVGSTSTGVCFAIKSDSVEMTEPYVIQNWPGSEDHPSDKVPTTLFYHSDRRVSWGFTAEHDYDAEGELIKRFVAHLEPNFTGWEFDFNSYPPPSLHHCQCYCEDFLRGLYLHIKSYFIDNPQQWNTSRIEFLFSVPPMWRPSSTEDFRRLAVNAGFGKDGPQHVVQALQVDFTAAAYHTLTAQAPRLPSPAPIMIVAAGGGTTDVTLYKLSHSQRGDLLLSELIPGLGIRAGSTHIDFEFAELAAKRLLPLAQQLGMTHSAMHKIIASMTRKEFRLHKEEFGSPMSMSQPVKKIPIPGLSDTVTIPSHGVIEGHLVIDNSKIQRLFDRQLDMIYSLIDEQFRLLAVTKPGELISAIVLTGGLGSSQYVKNHLIQGYTLDRPYKCAPDLHIVAPPNPQLAVVKGLVQDRMQWLKLAESHPTVGEGGGSSLPDHPDYQNFIRASSSSAPSLRQIDHASTKYSDFVAYRMDQMSMKRVEGDGPTTQSLSHIQLNPSDNETASHASVRRMVPGIERSSLDLQPT